ncbi:MULTISPECIES: lysophospholipid acyltransferase family protein [Herbaspirillum]|uniref:lysophospholipid acyltransferase family protein n=1 Tax=Herbaspirillum TaxID=963 RepID=UPI000981F607|nr:MULTISPECIES: lysophospholipid acyltransferase family protein [unclassified Herbaspirillum]MCI1014384.1 1-acyl-sn-glycerol-3-phosphate acyltransferase [Herbaspirillum sp. C7C2]ONN67100.1 1-acyl-sn-glycerol-3-phosphate acyltransferase [Herbaspirillum sp. VT-16-41]
MFVFRLLRLIAHLFKGMAVCAFLFPLTGKKGQEAHIRRWSRKLLRICGISVEIDSPLPLQRSLLVSNHVSWLDIFVVNSLQPCRFVAKSEIRGWPLIGWLCAKTGTIFISRGKASDVRRIFKGLVESIEKDEHVAFFPEGTTAAQGTLLPFHANLFEAAIDARAPVQPYALRYVDAAGNLHGAADFIGDMSIAESILTILKARGMRAQLKQLPIINTEGAHRRDLARSAREVIATGLGYSLESLSPAGAPADTAPGTAPDPQVAPH